MTTLLALVLLARLCRFRRPLVLLLVLWMIQHPLAGQTYPGKVGMGLEGLGGRGLEFVDVAKTLRPWEAIDGGPVAKDADGWPLADARTVFFDLRPTGAWLPQGPDDPDRYQIELGGLYKLSFTGRAVLSSAGDPFEVVDQRYDPVTNRTTAGLLFPKGKGLLIVNFTETDGGVRDVRLIRPGYPADTEQVFHTPFLKALEPFETLRFMDFLATNNNSPEYPAVTEWADRKLPSHATQLRDGGRQGAAWEYVIELANQAGKNAWINVPAAATDEYIRQLATMMHNNLRSELVVYVEYSNEVWNDLFSQAGYNRTAALAEVQAGSSNLNDDGATTSRILASRRHARRTLEIGTIFREAFGPAASDRVRPILSWWTIRPSEYRDMLNWVQRRHGPPKDHFYGIATTGYFSDSKASLSATPQQILAAMRLDADGSVPNWLVFKEIALDFSIKHFVYEGGPDTGGSATNLANRIRAQRLPEMKDLLAHHLRDNWFATGGDLFMYFTLTSAYSQYGCWGATEDITRLDTPKLQALYELLETEMPGYTKRALFPLYRGDAACFTGFAVSNYGDNPVNMKLWAFGNDGALLGFPDMPAYSTLPAHTQLARLGSELFAVPSGASQAGWVMGELDGDVGSFLQYGGDGFLDGAVAYTGWTISLYFTCIAEGPNAFRGEPARTVLSLANPVDWDVDVYLRLVNSLTGRVLAPQQMRTIPPLGYLSGSIRELFGVDVQDGAAYVVVEGVPRSVSPPFSNRFVGLGFLELPQSGSAVVFGPNHDYRGSPVSGMYSAQLAAVPGLFTNIRLVNTSNELRKASLTALSNTGQIMAGPVQVELAPEQAFQQDAGTLFGVSELVGTLKVQCDGWGIVGDVLFGDTALKYAAALPLQERTFKKAVFSQVANTADFFTGLAFYNAGEDQAKIEILVYSRNGALTGTRELTLDAGTRISKLLEELIPDTKDQVRGYIQVQSDQPLVAQQLFGDGKTVLSAVPPTVIE